MPIKTRRVPFHVLIIVVLTLFGATTIAQAGDDCDDPDRRSKTVKLKIKVNHGNPTGVVKSNDDSNADQVTVCRGDSIEWKTNEKDFFIDFPDNTPFSGGHKKNSNSKRLMLTVSEDAERGRSYKYDVGIVDGGILDPMIIVD